MKSLADITKKYAPKKRSAKKAPKKKAAKRKRLTLPGLRARHSKRYVRRQLIDFAARWPNADVGALRKAVQDVGADDRFWDALSDLAGGD